MRVALYQPEIPQNTGSVLRTAACLGVGVDVIEPCGFVWSDAKLRRAGMDYIEGVDLIRWKSWAHFLEARAGAARPGRLILLSVRGRVAHVDIAFRPDDTLLLGQESAGVPDDVHAMADIVARIPMRPGFRSLNVAVSGAIVLAEALRQTGAFPPL